MLKHLSKLCLLALCDSLLFLIPYVPSNFIIAVKTIFLRIWIDSLLPESYHLKSLTWGESSQMCLNRITKTFWLILNRFKIVWIVSIIILGTLNRFKLCLNRINHHSPSGLSFCCLNWFTHLMNRFTMLFLAEFLHLLPKSI